MILFLECIVGCLLFTLMILPAQYKDPIKMIMSYPPNIRKRVEELPQYMDSIQKREKAHIGKKLRIPGTEDMEKDYKDYFFHAKGACIGTLLGVIIALASAGIIKIIL